jgi:hypothetical protein
MKKIILSAAILFSSCLLFKSADAQLRINLGFNIGSQPDWGPVGYDHAEYYYIPDVDAYYDVPNHQYVYFENNVWVHRSGLPARYANYDLYNGYKVVVNERNPWLQHSAIRAKYSSFRGRRGQAIIRNSHDSRYRNHWNGGPGHGGPGHGGPGHDDHGRPGNGGDHGNGGPGHGGDHGNGGRPGGDHGNGGRPGGDHGDHGHGDRH